MDQIKSFIFTVIAFMAVIYFLPTLIYLFLVITAIVMVFIIWQKYKLNKILEEATKQQSQYTHSNSQEEQSIIEDAIDVEFSESEDDYD